MDYLCWAGFWAGLNFELGSIDKRVISGQRRLVAEYVTSVPGVIKRDAMLAVLRLADEHYSLDG